VLTLSGPADGAVFRVGQQAQWTIAASDATTGPHAVAQRPADHLPLSDAKFQGGPPIAAAAGAAQDRDVKRILIALSLAVAVLALTGAPARADGTVTVHINGGGHIGGSFDCTGHADGSNTGTCAVFVQDVLPDDCGIFNPPCPQSGSAFLDARNGDTIPGFIFDRFLPPNVCGTNRVCTVGVGLGSNPNNPTQNDFTVSVNFKDNQAPTATVTAPANGAAVRGTIPLTATAVDNTGVASLTFRVGGNPFQTFEVPPFTTNLNTTLRGDGPLTISATATDLVGLTNQSAITVTVDNTIPTLTVTGPDNQTFGPGATPTWAIAANDAATDFGVRCSVVPTGQPPVFGNCTSTTQERLVNPADGRYTLTVRVTDLAGNFVERTKAFAVDTGPPNTTIASGPDDGSSTQDSTLTWGFAASEPGSTFQCRVFLTTLGANAFGPCSSAATHTVGGLGAGSYTFEVRASDVFGNTDATPARRTVTVVAPPAPPAVILPPVVQPVIQRVVVVTLTFSYHDATKRATRISALVVNSVPEGSTVTARCPKGCATKTFVKKNAKGNVSLKALAGKKPLKAKTKITVTVSKPGAVSAVKVLEVQKSKAPTVKSFCQPPGAKTPGPCA
jgi:Bacterial Ig domain